ncbi:uncharacterized protein LOC134538157 [Bacillus rossius redtenbacheri]|uniref:uncharacterized protein LOC134538157 n=1 Tax=Bacillus rossius redtenbacheri TaxID=93214 RepID=UPI002FDED681
MDWTDDKSLQLIELYSERSVLWHAEHPHYKSHSKKNEAWCDIAAVIAVDAGEAKRKMASLLATYRKVRHKVLKLREKGAGADDLYEVTWFAFESFSFLEQSYQPRPSRQLIKSEDDDKALAVRARRKRKCGSVSSEDSQAPASDCTAQLSIAGPRSECGEFEAVGINVAAKLRRMDPEQQIHAEFLISKVLKKGLLNQLTEHCDVG